ncbi:IS4 family transposase [Saccharopolyspora phatthalungensis]|uniref:Transposase n=1 Tax=Saccharopolyspora phatthalungensis TaxID=664693 RepID=A0A840QDY9_9PSEU|nr:IS4 family transposase [Saccharopolyspora phatthalungensis]MBB5156878.1 hypothetical protein [Saccharopolyspora phatthalungensis]
MVAPGHLGELTRIVPFEMVDDVLAGCGRVQARVRKLPSRVVVYLLLAAGLFEGLGFRGVWARLVAGLDGLRVPRPSATAIRLARQRLGVAPLKALFDLLRGPAAGPRTAGTRWRNLLVTAIDGTTMDVPDTPANTGWLGKHGGTHRKAGYPHVRVAALVACGTRTILDAVFGPRSQGETTLARQLVPSMGTGMLVLGDRMFGCQRLLAAITGTGAHVLVRLKRNRKTPVLHRYPDGSFLSVLGGLKVRVITCEITIATTAGRRSEIYRLATTLCDDRRYPAGEIITLYHQRWEIETAYLELKSTILGSRVLRSQTPDGIAQEIYALLTVYQVLRIAITDAAEAAGVDPDRASFTTALHTARDQLVQAANVITGTVIDLVGTIGGHVLDNLLPPRRLRVSPRAVKRPLSRYAHQSLRIDRTSYKATLDINLLTEDLTTSPSP